MGRRQGTGRQGTGCILADLVFDTATALSQGRRDRQEDAVVSDFQTGCEHGFAVLADGMGGHAGGDIASKIVVTEVFSELKLRSGDVTAMEQDLEQILRGAAHSANECIRHHAETYPGTEGMGATLLAPVFFGDRRDDARVDAAGEEDAEGDIGFEARSNRI